MNDNEFIENALKEHARLENKDDQDFLDQLEGKIDAQNITELKVEEKDSGKKKFFWPAIAATVAVSAVAISSMFQDETNGEVAALVADRKETETSEVRGIVPERDNRMATLDRNESRVDVTGPSDAAPLLLSPRAIDRRMPSIGENKGGNKRGKDFLVTNEGEKLQSSDPVTRPSLPGKNNTDFLYSDVKEKPVPPSSSMAQIAKRSRNSKSFGAFGEASDSVDFDLDIHGLRGSRGRGLMVDPVQPGDKYGALVEGGFLTPLSSPLSTFSIDVDTASYSNIRRHIMNGQRLNPNAVRIEEMINYFDYNYAQPEEDHPFSVHTEVASCPWNPKHRLVKIGLQGEKIDEGERKAANLVFLLDVSGSMKSADKLPLLVQSFQILLKQLNEEDRVSLVVYAGRQAVLLNPTAIDEDGRTQVSEALKKLSAGGSTAGAAGIKTAYDLARKGFVEGGVNRVILATDGDFNVGTTDHKELLKLVKNQAEGNISLTVLGFGQGNLNDAMMEKLTNSGDGNYFYIDSLREGQKVFQQGLTGTIQTIAKDVKIQVDFNRGKVGQYRLIGYANRRLKDEDFKNDKVDAGDIGAGHRVTALYEIVPVGVAVKEISKYEKVKEVANTELIDSPELLTVKLRYKQPDGEVSTELAHPLTDEGNVWEMASEDFRFSSGVALWGMLLRNSSYSGGGTPELVSELALGGQGDDVTGDRAEMLDLLRRWSSRQ